MIHEGVLIFLLLAGVFVVLVLNRPTPSKPKTKAIHWSDEHYCDGTACWGCSRQRVYVKKDYNSVSIGSQGNKTYVHKYTCKSCRRTWLVRHA